MKQKKNRSTLGKASLAVLALALISIFAVTAILGSNASAQGQGGGKVSMNDISFGPAALEPIDPNLPLASESMVVGLLLPAVQLLNEPAANVDVLGDGFSLTVPAFGRIDRSLVNFRIWIERNPTAPGFFLNVQEPGGNVRRMPIEHKELVIRVRGATQSDRTFVQAETASVRHNTVGNILTSGGNQPVLIGLLLPAVHGAH